MTKIKYKQGLTLEAQWNTVRGDLVHKRFNSFLPTMGYRVGTPISVEDGRTPDGWTPEGYPVELKSGQSEWYQYSSLFAGRRQLWGYMLATGAPEGELWMYRVRGNEVEYWHEETLHIERRPSMRVVSIPLTKEVDNNQLRGLTWYQPTPKGA